MFRSPILRVGVLVAGALALAWPPAAAPVDAAAAPAHAHTTASWILAWSKTLPGDPVRMSSPVAAVLADQQVSAVVGTLGGHLAAFHLSDGAVPAGWPAAAPHPFDSSPAAVADGLGLDNVYVGDGTFDQSGPGGSYLGYDPNGSTQFSYAGADPNQPAMRVSASPSVAPLVCHTGPSPAPQAMVAGGVGLEAYALSINTGQPIPGWPVATTDTTESSPAVVTVGGQNLVIEGEDSSSPPGGNVRAVTGSGQVLWQHFLGDVVTSSPAVGPLGGTVAVAVGAGTYWAQRGYPAAPSETLTVLSAASGSTLWSRDLGGFTSSSPALADLTGGGGLDVVEAAQGNPSDPNAIGRVFAFDGAGNPLPNWPVTLPANADVIGSVVTADLTGSGYQDVLVPTTNGLYVYDGRSGQLVFSDTGTINLQNSPLVTVDPDGSLGVTLAGSNPNDAGQGVIQHYEITGSTPGTLGWPMFRHDPAHSGSTLGPPAAQACPAGEAGYRFVASDGGIFDFGNAGFYGSAAGQSVSPVVAMAPTPSQAGYWVVHADGAVSAFGNARNFGGASLPGTFDAGQIVGMAATPTGDGYWLVDNHGGIYSYGDARYFGSKTLQLSNPVVGMAATANGAGYWIVTGAGTVYAFGNAAAYGSAQGVAPFGGNRVVGMAATPDGLGYWLVGADGGIFTFGDARFFGSMGGIRLNQPVVGMTGTPDGGGYIEVAADGGIFTFGDARFFGSTGNIRLNKPIVGMTTT